MKDRTIEILREFKAGDISEEEAQRELFELLIGNKKFAVGSSVKITNCIYGHEFEIDEVVKIISYETENNQTTSWLCMGNNGKEWYINEEEGVVV